jgi:hypothetical protein
MTFIPVTKHLVYSQSCEIAKDFFGDCVLREGGLLHDVFRFGDADQRGLRTADAALSESACFLSQAGVFCLGLLENRDVTVGAFPEGEEVLVGSSCFNLISRQRERSTKL